MYEDYNDDSEMTLESQGIIMNSILTEGLSDDERVSMCENAIELETMLAEEIVTERTIVKLDKKATHNRNFMVALFTIAREKKNRKYGKLVTLWKMEKLIEKDLIKQYGSEANRRAKVMTQKASKSRAMGAKKAAGVVMPKTKVKTSQKPLINKNIKRMG